MQHQVHIQHRTCLSGIPPPRPHSVLNPALRPVTRTKSRLRLRSSADTSVQLTNNQPQQHLSNGSLSIRVGPNGEATYHVESAAGPDAQHTKQFNWYKAWYPLAVLHNLDRDVPTHARVLGIDLAVWFDKHASKWRVFQDRCPHRLAPLSEGRIDDKSGNLYCNYHGWQFDGSGACTDIPQLAPGQSVGSKRSCVTSYQTCEREGLLWVWPDSSPTAAAESADAAVWPGLAPELDLQGHSNAQLNRTWYFRDIPACWLAVKENAFNDPSHDLVLHHGTNPIARRERAAPLDVSLVEMGPSGYTVRETSGRFQDTARFPCGSRREGSFFIGVAYIVPTGVGTCRQFHCFVTPTDKRASEQQKQKPLLQQQQQQEEGNGVQRADHAAASSSSSSAKQSGRQSPNWGRAWMLLRALRALKPTWLLHMDSHILVDADVAMQSKIDVQRAIDDRVYMPAAADAGPAAFMRWLREYGDHGPPVAKLNDPFVGHAPTSTLQSDRRQLLDRYWSHTASCKDCRKAHERFKVLQQAAGVFAMVAASATLTLGAFSAFQCGDFWASDTLTITSWSQVGDVLMTVCGTAAACFTGVCAGVAGVVWAAVGRLIRSFEFIDYDKHHASKR